MKNININKTKVKEQDKQSIKIKKLTDRNKKLREELKLLKNFINHTPFKNKKKVKVGEKDLKMLCPKCQNEIKKIKLNRINGVLVLHFCNKCKYKETLKLSTDMNILQKG